jgi:hypothetical protein
LKPTLSGRSLTFCPIAAPSGMINDVPALPIVIAAAWEPLDVA